MNDGVVLADISNAFEARRPASELLSMVSVTALSELYVASVYCVKITCTVYSETYRVVSYHLYRK